MVCCDSACFFEVTYDIWVVALFIQLWKLFVGFAKTNKFEPTLASPAQLAKFLTHLFDNRKVKPSTIKGYRAAIGHILRLATGYDPGEDPIIKTLIQSFERQKPTTRNNTPTWDVALVLEA